MMVDIEEHVCGYGSNSDAERAVQRWMQDNTSSKIYDVGRSPEFEIISEK